MSILKRSNWFISFVLTVFTPFLFPIILGSALNLYEKDAWYLKWQYWVIGTICFIFPAFIMLIIFSIEMLVKAASKLGVSGSEIYTVPYIWILCIIIPIIGWILLIVMYIYLNVYNIVMLYRGNGEKYIKE